MKEGKKIDVLTVNGLATWPRHAVASGEAAPSFTEEKANRYTSLKLLPVLKKILKVFYTLPKLNFLKHSPL